MNTQHKREYNTVQLSASQSSMQLLINNDTTTLSYWLNWRVVLCAVWVFTSIVLASFLIWKYEHPKHSKSERGRTRQENSWIFYNDEVWRPCLKEIHPVYLMVFRIVAFSLLLAAIACDVLVHGGSLFYYYTQWTFTLVTIYFGFGSLLSIYGCLTHRKMNCGVNDLLRIDAEQGLYTPLTFGENVIRVKTENSVDHQGTNFVPLIAGPLSYLFQILFQMTAGAVMLTDSVYWFVIVPFLTLRDYDLNFLTVVAHSLNAILLLGEAALNSLPFPWFRISYFILLTGIYVIFEWVVHACVSTWWPYPFLDLSSVYAPIWYLVVALLHFPCYGIFALVVEAKYYLLSKLSAQT